MRSTMMACEPALMQADQAITALLSTPQQVRVEESAPPRLRLVSAAGETSTWLGEATAETRFGGPGERVFLEVAPQRIACNHPLIPNHQCLQVREIRYDANSIKQAPLGEWQPLYDGIEGFEFRSGERKVLRLNKFKRDPAAADASAIVYVLSTWWSSRRSCQPASNSCRDRTVARVSAAHPGTGTGTTLNL